jgi:hypothetical protein
VRDVKATTRWDPVSTNDSENGGFWTEYIVLTDPWTGLALHRVSEYTSCAVAADFTFQEHEYTHLPEPRRHLTLPGRRHPRQVNLHPGLLPLNPGSRNTLGLATRSGSMLSLVGMRFTDRLNEADYGLNTYPMTRARNQATITCLQYRLCNIFSLAFYHDVAWMS